MLVGELEKEREKLIDKKRRGKYQSNGGRCSDNEPNKLN